MSLPIENTAEGGSSGTTVNAGNSGGRSGVAWDNVTVGANMTLKFDDSITAARGGKSYKLALTSTATTISHLDWTAISTGSGGTTIYGRFYFQTNVASISSTIRLVAFKAGGTLLGYLGCLNTNQGFQWRTAADAVSGTVSGTISANTWYRVEFQAVAGGVSVANIYVGDSTTIAGTATSASGCLTAGTIDAINIGTNTAAFSAIAGNAFWLDELQLNANGFPGPADRSPILSKNIVMRPGMFKPGLAR